MGSIYRGIQLLILALACLIPVSLSGQNHALVLHGGAGNMQESKMSEEKKEEYEIALKEGLSIGNAILDTGGSAMDAVEAVIVYLENNSLFNAGKGAILAKNGMAELDASFMNGENLDAGSVASVRYIKNPIKAARLAMSKSPYVMMVADGAEDFARDQGLEMVDTGYFRIPRRMEWYKRKVAKDERGATELMWENPAFGTVGCVALDKEGNIAAGTSTGGRGFKKYRRVGDSPIIGAGTYADNETCGISGTGYGEYFMRGLLAYDVSARMKYGHATIQDAAHQTIHGKLEDMGATGGIIGLDGDGNVIMEFNTPGMFRGYQKQGGEPVVEMFGD